VSLTVVLENSERNLRRAAPIGVFAATGERCEAWAPENGYEALKELTFRTTDILARTKAVAQATGP